MLFKNYCLYAKGGGMGQEDHGFPMRTIVLIVIFVPVIAYLIYFSMKKNSESEMRANQCQTDCTAKGYSGHEFKWNVLSGPVCSCLGDVQP